MALQLFHFVTYFTSRPKESCFFECFDFCASLRGMPSQGVSLFEINCLVVVIGINNLNNFCFSVRFWQRRYDLVHWNGLNIFLFIFMVLAQNDNRMKSFRLWNVLLEFTCKFAQILKDICIYESVVSALINCYFAGTAIFDALVLVTGTLTPWGHWCHGRYFWKVK